MRPRRTAKRGFYDLGIAHPLGRTFAKPLVRALGEILTGGNRGNRATTLMEWRHHLSTLVRRYGPGGIVGEADVDEPVTERFRSHSNYLEAFCQIGGRDPLHLSERAIRTLAENLRSLGALDRKPPEIDTAQVHRSLRNAWSAEVLLALPSRLAAEEDEFIRLSNTWGAVQAYYVGYHATQALLVAKGYPRPQSHLATQNQYATLWANRPLRVPPLSIGVNHDGAINIPEHVVIDADVHPWAACSRETCWSLALKALRTTRDHHVEIAIKKRRDDLRAERRKQWLEAEQNRLAAGRQPRKQPHFPRPRLTTAQKLECAKRVRTYTVLDYLYRLRVVANYDDAAIFIDGPERTGESLLVHRRLNFIGPALCLGAEVRIRQLVGGARFDGWAAQFASRNIPSDQDVGIKARLAIHQAADDD